MNMTKRLLLILAAFLCLGAAPSFAQQNFIPIDVTLAAAWDLDSTSFTYCRTVGASGVATDKNKLGRVKITAAASTTVTGTNAFANVAVGDILYINQGATGGPGGLSSGIMLQRVVMARASASSITIDVSSTFTNASWEYRTLQCGTASTSGAFSIDAWRALTVDFHFDQCVLTIAGCVIYQLECRSRGPGSTTWNIVSGPTTLGTTGNTAITTTTPYSECRVGVKLQSADDAGDLTTNAEKFTILVTGQR